MKKIYLFIFLIFVFSCIKEPHEVGWFLTIRIPGKLKRTTVREKVSESDKYKVIADSVFHLQRRFYTNLQNYQGYRVIVKDTLKKFIPEIIDTTRSEFGSLLFLIYSGARYKGNVLSSPCSLKTKIVSFAWDDIADSFYLFKSDSVKGKVTGNFEITHRLPFDNFPAGPHLFIVIPQIISGIANFDTVETFKEALLGARILGDNIITFPDTIENKSKNIRDAAKENRIQRVFLHFDVKHSLPIRLTLYVKLFSSSTDTFTPINALLFEPAPKNEEGVSTDSTSFSWEIDISKDIIDLAKDSIIYYIAKAVVDSQGNAYIKPDDFIKLKGYLGVTVYTLERE
mgnify:CR=1 FL=1